MSNSASSKAPSPLTRSPLSFAAAALLQRCRTTRQLKQAHAALLVRGLPLPPSAPSLLRPAISFSALHPSGDLHYALLFLLFSLPPPAALSRPSARAAAAVRFLYNTTIRGLARRPRPGSALPASALLFRRMAQDGLSPSSFTFTFLLQACASGSTGPGAALGRQLHAAVVKNAALPSDTCVRNSLIRFYSAYGELGEAKLVFAEAGDNALDIVSWNSLVDGCLSNGDVVGALVLFDRMPDRNTVSWNGLITGLLKNTRLDAARCMFDSMPEKNLVSWAVMILGYAQNRQPREALQLFREMQLVHQELNTSALVSALSAASQMGSLSHGKWIHSYINRHAVRIEPSLSTALISMYANCGNIGLAMQLYYSLKSSQKDQSTYTAAIFGLAMNGHGSEALQLFENMRNEGLRPDRVSYLAVLYACSHMGWVKRGFEYFEYMVSVDGIEAELDHYACMVDLLGRAGFLKEAEQFIASMPIQPDNVIWGALLNACRIYGNAEMGKRLGELLIESDQLHDGRYVALSNILVESSDMNAAEQVRETMKSRIDQRTPGFSSIEVNGIVHEFVAGDKSHEKTAEIYNKWEEIVREIRKVGYAAETRVFGFDVEEEEREVAIGYHSEKLAIAFGFISSEDKAPLRIVKNIRICRDCHSAIKLISLVFERKIVVRDRRRFHHFEGGMCSCMDFW